MIGTPAAALVVVLGVRTAIVACLPGGDDLPPGITPTHFLASALTDLAAVALLAGAHWHDTAHRRLHQGYLAGAAASPIAADVGARALVGTAASAAFVGALR